MRTSVQRGGLGLTGIFLVLAVLATLSARAGGPVSWQITTGSSMLPGITAGTLVVTHRQSSYEVGDVVAYRSRQLGKIVLHRVVEVQGDRLVLRGDNNDFLDPEKPRVEDALGSRVFQIRGVGGPLQWLRQPWALITGGVLVAVFLVLGKEQRRRSRRAPSSGPSRRRPALRSPSTTPVPSTAGAPDVLPRLLGALPPVPAGVELAARCVLGASLAFAALASGGPFLQSTEARGDGSRTLTFGYTADARPGLVYPDGEVATGDVLYPRLVDTAQVTAELAHDLPEDAEVSGTWHLEVSVQNADGWTRTASATPSVPVDGGAQRLTTALPVTELLAVAHRVERESGVASGSLAFSVRAVLDLTVTSDGDASTTQATPHLDFRADDSKVVVDPGTPLVQTTPVVLSAETSVARLRFAGLSLPAASTRSTALLAAGVCGLLLALTSLARRVEDEDARIVRTAGHSLVNADPAEDPEQVIDVDSFAALERIAERYERVLMCGDHTGIPFYYVLDEGIAYRYYTARSAARFDAAEAARAGADPEPREPAEQDLEVGLALLEVPRQREAEPAGAGVTGSGPA